MAMTILAALWCVTGLLFARAAMFRRVLDAVCCSAASRWRHLPS
jgi:hypothetical protein